MPNDDAEVDLDALLDLATPWSLRVVATLRVADLMADGMGDVEALAAAADCDPVALHQVLSHLVSKGVFREEAQGRFALNPAAEALRAQSPFLDLEGIGGRFAGAWSALLTYTRTGEPGYAEIFGRPFWRDLGANPELAEGFDALMGPARHSQPDADLEITGGWEAVANVVDVGGGTGAFLATLLGRHPHLHGTLVDLPGTVERSAAVLDAAGVTSRAEAVGQSFFDPLPAGADVYVLRKVLNDWPDEETVAILRRCAEAARPDGRVLVLGGVAPTDARRPLTVETVLVGGRVNTVDELRSLAAEARLQVTRSGPSPSGELVVECRPEPG